MRREKGSDAWRPAKLPFPRQQARSRAPEWEGGYVPRLQALITPVLRLGSRAPGRERSTQAAKEYPGAFAGPCG